MRIADEVAPARPVYLDNHATTRVDPRVVAAMLPHFTEHYGNAASFGHAFGWRADEAVESARRQVAALVAGDPDEVVFTSGATEANNLALKGIAAARGGRGHFVASAIEHRSVLDVLRRLGREGCSVALVPPDRSGRVDPERVAGAIRPETILVSVMAANNEVGTINPIGDIAAVCATRGVPLHVDATQAVGKVDWPAEAPDLVSASAHKLYGPKGIGMLLVRARSGSIRPRPLLDGGGHERGLRSGTLAVPLIVGFGVAAELARFEESDERSRLVMLRDRLWAGLAGRISGLVRNGHPVSVLPGNLHVSIPGIDGERLLASLRDVAVSSGAACSAAEPNPSHVLAALGIDEPLARASLRFGLGRFTTAEEVDFATESVSDMVARLGCE